MNIEIYLKYTYDGCMQVAGEFNDEEIKELEAQGYKSSKKSKKSKKSSRQVENKNGILITS